MYSQSGNLEGFMDRIYGARTGFFLEIGCWDASNLSQTLYLEQQGWKGLCVDPFPRGFENRKCMICNKAVSSNGKDREFLWVTTDKRNGGDVSYLSGFKDSVNAHLPFIQENCNYTETVVETITVPQLYRKYKLPSYIEFLSVDVEGAEVEVFSGFNLDYYRFGVITFEHNGNGNVQSYIGRLLERRGYRFSMTISLAGFETDDVYISGGLL